MFIETDFSPHRYNNRRQIENLQSKITTVCRLEKLHENLRKVKLLSPSKWTGTGFPIIVYKTRMYDNARTLVIKPPIRENQTTWSKYPAHNVGITNKFTTILYLYKLANNLISFNCYEINRYRQKSRRFLRSKNVKIYRVSGNFIIVRILRENKQKTTNTTNVQVY